MDKRRLPFGELAMLHYKRGYSKELLCKHFKCGYIVLQRNLIFYKIQIRKPAVSKNVFKKGHIPWNKGKKNIHVSQRTEFKKGDTPVNWRLVGTIRKRRWKNGTTTRFIKVAEPNKWIPFTRWLWIQEYGEIKEDDKIVHIDRDSLNDSMDNLIALPPHLYLSYTKWKRPFTKRVLTTCRRRYA